jgi:c(7)-type cytochrome triheme protein
MQGAIKVKRYTFLLALFLILPVILYAKEFKVVTFTTGNAGKVIFDHDIHMLKSGNNCTACHNSIFQVKRSKTPVTMAEMEKGKSCGTCHNKIKAFPLSECVRCHPVKEVPIVIPDFGTLIFSHNFHLNAYGCADCHNKLFKAGPNNPHVSMKQMEKGVSCGGCHDGKSAFSVKGDCTKCHAVKDVPFSADALFSHKAHVSMYGCNDCHSKIFVAGPKSVRYTMIDMEKGKSCGACHDGKSAFSVKGDCGKCHKGAKEIDFAKDEAVFSHRFHLNVYKCADCHSGIFIGGASSKRYNMEEMEKGRSCGACHDGSIAFNVTGSCGKCHKGTKDKTFNIKDAGIVKFSHPVHQSMYKCDDCHNKVFYTGLRSRHFTMAEMQKGYSCGACHNGKGAFPVTGGCGKCHPTKEITFVDDARFSHVKHTEMYSCYECHSKLFQAGPDNRRYTMPDMEKGASCGACHNGSSGFSVKGDCDKCHKSTIEVTINVPTAGATIFSHKVHGAMYKCVDCHNGIIGTGVAAKRYTMADMEKGRSCGACHDDKSAFTVKKNCTKCHPVKDIAYKESAALFSHAVHIAAYGCSDCHDKIFIPGPGNRRATMPDMEKGFSCGACHDGKTVFGVTASCEKCHKATKAIRFEMPKAAEKLGSVLFSHKGHMSHGYGCTDCHSKVIQAGVLRRPSTMKMMEEGKSCGSCHGSSMAFSVRDSASCDRCHGGRPVGLPQGPPQ